MNFIKYLIILLTLLIPYNLYAQGDDRLLNTDLLYSNSTVTSTQLSAYYDLRDRQSYIQVTNFSNVTQSIHVQIFQHDRECDELNFDDTLTPNDTVIYDLDNIIKNDGTPVPVNLLDDSYGYVVISKATNASNGMIVSGPALIGNFRIIDQTGYEYRTNMISTAYSIQLQSFNLIANFNTADGAIYSDIIGYSYDDAFSVTVRNIDNGFSFDVFVFDLSEEPLSCDTRNFACGNVMNYGINEDYMASRGEDLLCPGGGLADQNGGFISFENGANLDGTPPGTNSGGNDVFVGLIGINNNNGTGSMDIWWFGNRIF